MIQAKEVKSFDILADGKSLGWFRVISEWEGLMKLECINTKDVLIVCPKKTGLGSIMEGIFTPICGEVLKDMSIILASPQTRSYS